ncbi:uncharacterized protein LOC108596071 [Drosophila busckii]|uniref:uncharacterized protein LOC108596071 n=1 Tax=Drosophila busckii TaxID=30019 RepID=UPI001432953C|nr:uncharacterized protein LOC108596071 [Drosophila busckii]
MKNARILRSCNILLLLTGYQLHWFDLKQQRYRLAWPCALHILLLCGIYAACFAQHFERSSLLQLLHDVSPFLHGLTRLQLLLGLKVFAYALYASLRVVGVASELTTLLPLQRGRAKVQQQLQALALLCGSLLLLLSFGIYIGYELNFELPPRQHVMIAAALFMPHLALAGALRFYNMLSWLLQQQLQQLQSQVATSSELELQAQWQLLQQLTQHFARLFNNVQHSLLLLLSLNFNCLLAAVHSFVFYRSSWHLLFDERHRRIFYAGNACIYACICSDYATLLWTQHSLQQQFMLQLHALLTPRHSSVLSKRLRQLLKDMRDVLYDAFKFKFLAIWRFNTAQFTLLLCLQLLGIAVIVVYQYLNDAVLQTNERLDSNADDD